MKKLACILLLTIIFYQSAFAAHTAMVGGFRDGLAIGLEIDEHVNKNLMYRYGLEGTPGDDMSLSGSNPLVLFAGLRSRISKMGDSPVSLGLGVAGYYGDKTNIGVSLSVIFDSLYNNNALFLETGIDYLTDHGHLAFQIGYRFIDADISKI